MVHYSPFRRNHNLEEGASEGENMTRKALFALQVALAVQQRRKMIMDSSGILQIASRLTICWQCVSSSGNGKRRTGTLHDRDQKCNLMNLLVQKVHSDCSDHHRAQKQQIEISQAVVLKST